MEFHQLRYFVAAAETQNMTAAARKLHVSQPALSRQIAQLEEELGVALFARVRKRIRLSEAGSWFLPRARQILCDAETAAQLLREQYAAGKRTLRLGFLSVFLDDLIGPALKALRREKPSIDVSLFELPARAQLDRLRDGELDLAVVGNVDEADRERFAIRRLRRSRMAIVLPDDHPLAGRKQLALRELRDDALVSLSDDYFPGRRRFLTEIFRPLGFDPKIVEESPSLSLLLAAVAAGTGVALLPHHSRKLPHAGCVFVPLKTPAVYAEVLAVFHRKTVSPLLDRLLQRLSAAAEAISED